MKMLIYQGDLPPSCATPVPEADVLATLDLKVSDEHGLCFNGPISRGGLFGFFRIVDYGGEFVVHQDSAAVLGVTLPYTVYIDNRLIISGKAMDILAPWIHPSLGADCPECFGTGLRGGSHVPCSSPTCKLPIG